MQVFGLEPHIASLAITILGITGSVILGWLKGGNEFNPRNVAASALIGFVISLSGVATAVGAIEVTDPNAQLIVVAMLIGSVMGIDMGVKNGAKAAIIGIGKAKSGQWGQINTGNWLASVIGFLENELQKSQNELEMARQAGESDQNIKGIQNEIEQTSKQLQFWYHYSKQVKSWDTWLN
ncbi:MAG: hypothetical protein K5785_00970 [Nitrosarchaeum sp.]|nr:hypothetical protein [Nitrosarchaeum sp.]